MAPLQGPQIPEVNYMELLNKELASCCMPSITDVAEANPDDITRDMYRVLSGNGNLTGGLIVKVATANVNIQIMQKTVGAVIEAQKTHIAHCNKIMEREAKQNLTETVKNDMIRKAITFVWENKSFIGGAVLAVAVYMNSLTAQQAVVAAASERDTAEALSKKIDAKLNSIMRVQDMQTPPAPALPPTAATKPRTP